MQRTKATAICLWLFLCTSPWEAGLESIVGQRGAKLSGGQCQRTAAAMSCW
ncbi:MAG: hypothetical protein KF832_12425 [Caldilineaceae bacterium]|nr:hypothetical protein [Caldilineaceae bacterium]